MNATSAISTRPANPATKPGYIIAARLAAQRVVLLELVGHAAQRVLEDAARLAGRDHRHVELVEDVGVLGERVGERDAGLDVGAHHGQRLLELVALGLLSGT